MTILKLVAQTYFPQVADGRFIYRPWGARGACYTLTAGQRTRRAWCVVALYVAMFAALWVYPHVTGPQAGVIAPVLAFLVLHYVLCWLFSLGLETIDPPPPLTPEQRRAALSARSRAMGRPLLWVFLILSSIFVLGGVLLVIDGDWLDGVLSILFFGACAATFIRQLRLIRAARGAGPG